MRRQVLSLLVENRSGVVSHISGLFSRRAFNIDSFSAGVTSDPGFTRITIVSTGDERDLDQIKKQLNKLEDVINIKELKSDDSVCRELVLVKIKAKDTDRQAILSVSKIFRARIIDVTVDSLIIELTGDQNKLDAFINLLKGYEVLELARTGFTGLTRGADNIVNL